MNPKLIVAGIVAYVLWSRRSAAAGGATKPTKPTGPLPLSPVARAPMAPASPQPAPAAPSTGPTVTVGPIQGPIYDSEPSAVEPAAPTIPPRSAPMVYEN
jgi:hypothetical protein